MRRVPDRMERRDLQISIVGLDGKNRFAVQVRRDLAVANLDDRLVSPAVFKTGLFLDRGRMNGAGPPVPGIEPERRVAIPPKKPGE